jgi:hypothetical protein
MQQLAVANAEASFRNPNLYYRVDQNGRIFVTKSGSLGFAVIVAPAVALLAGGSATAAPSVWR